MASDREKGLEIAREMLGGDIAAALQRSVGSREFGALRGELALDFVFGKLWSRPGLDRRARSLVTLGILIASGKASELRIHLPAALRNGCTVAEIEEAICHAAAYAGFPAANEAALIAADVFRQQGVID